MCGFQFLAISGMKPTDSRCVSFTCNKHFLCLVYADESVVLGQFVMTQGHPYLGMHMEVFQHSWHDSFPTQQENDNFFGRHRLCYAGSL
eukprot:1001674-Pelagomonas_calceolata.AAC.2